MSRDLLRQDDWVSEACTLPTADQPLRRAEFDELLVRDVVSIDQRSPHEVRFMLRTEPDVAARAADLAAKETNCCSFFTFGLTITEVSVKLDISTQPTHATVLAALIVRAQRLIGTGA